MRFVLFLLIAVGILAGLHTYCWVRLVRDTGLSGGDRAAATVAIVLLGISVPLSFLVGRLAPSASTRATLWVTYVWLGLLFLLVMLLLAVDVARLVLWLLGKFVPAAQAAFDPARRLMLARMTAGATVLGGGALTAWAVRSAASRIAVKEVRVRLDRLPAAFDGTTIVQLTDIHVGHLLGRRFVEQIVREVNALQPDLVAITGDLVDGTVEHLGEAVAPLGELHTRYGVYFVTGNHEYYVSPDQVSGADEWGRALEALGIRVLTNERVRIGSASEGFDLAGVTDLSARSLGGRHAPDLPGALRGRRAADELVLLAHQPKAIEEAALLGVGLQISGHTHGGQIWPWRYLVGLDQPYVSGLDRRGSTQIYVSRGTGYWGPPMRLAEPAEITRIVLESRVH